MAPIYSVNCNILEHTTRSKKYKLLSSNISEKCPVCHEKPLTCSSHVRAVKLPSFSYEIYPLYVNFYNRLRSNLCYNCRYVNEPFSLLRKKSIRIQCKKCLQKLVKNKKKNLTKLSEDESMITVTDSTNNQILLGDLCLGNATLTPPFLKKIPDKYFKNIPRLYSYLYCKNHAYISVSNRIHKRDSYIRSKILSKRVKYFGRSVISPSLNYTDVIKIQVPKLMARDRMLSSGDIVICNRYPTLSQESFVALKVEIKDELTLGIHPAIAPGLKADYDGDLSQIIPAHQYQEQAEALYLMYPENNFLAIQNNNNIIQFTQQMTYCFCQPENLELLIDLPVYFECESFIFHGRKSIEYCYRGGDEEGEGGEGSGMTVPITRKHLNDFMRHVYFQLGSRNAVEIFNYLCMLSSTIFERSFKGINLKDMIDLQLKRLEPESNIFLIQPTHEIKGKYANVLANLGVDSPLNFWNGIYDVNDHFKYSKIGRESLTQAVCLVSDSGYLYKKINIVLSDLIVSYLGSVIIQNKNRNRVLIYDLEFFLEYLDRISNIRNAVKYALYYASITEDFS